MRERRPSPFLVTTFRAPVRPPTSPPLRLVLFDMDDTIFDHMLTCRAAIERVRAEEPQLMALPTDRLWKEYLVLLDTMYPKLSAAHEEYGRFRAERFRRLAQLSGWEIDLPYATEISLRYRAHYQKLRRPVPGAPEFVRRMARRTRVGIVTNNEYSEQEEKLRFLGLDGVIDPLVVSAKEQVAKPDPRIYGIALARAGVEATETVMIGDSWKNDVLGARSAGIRPVWFNRFALARPSRHRAEEIRSFRPSAPVEAILRGRNSRARGMRD